MLLSVQEDWFRDFKCFRSVILYILYIIIIMSPHPPHPTPEYFPSNMKNVSVVFECFHFREWRAASLESAAKNKKAVSREQNK